MCNKKKLHRGHRENQSYTEKNFIENKSKILYLVIIFHLPIIIIQPKYKHRKYLNYSASGLFQESSFFYSCNSS